MQPSGYFMSPHLALEAKFEIPDLVSVYAVEIKPHIRPNPHSGCESFDICRINCSGLAATGLSVVQPRYLSIAQKNNAPSSSMLPFNGSPQTFKRLASRYSF